MPIRVCSASATIASSQFILVIVVEHVGLRWSYSDSSEIARSPQLISTRLKSTDLHTARHAAIVVSRDHSSILLSVISLAAVPSIPAVLLLRPRFTQNWQTVLIQSERSVCTVCGQPRCVDHRRRFQRYVVPVSHWTSSQDSALVPGWPTGPQLSSLSSVGRSPCAVHDLRPLGLSSRLYQAGHRAAEQTLRNAFKLKVLSFYRASAYCCWRAILI